MGIYQRDDVVSLSRAQSSLVRVRAAPAGVETFTINLPINPGDLRDFTYQAQGGETAAEVTQALEQELAVQQSVYSVAIGPRTDELMITGPLGTPFSVVVTSNLLLTLYEEAVRAVNNQTGELIGNVRILQGGSPPFRGRMREFATVDGAGELQERNLVEARELGTGTIFDLDARSIRTRVNPPLPIPFVPGVDGGIAIEGRGGWQAAYTADLSDRTWPALRVFGGDPLEVSLFSGLPVPARLTAPLLAAGVGASRINRALRADAATFFGTGGVVGPSNLPDISTVAVSHQRLIFRAPEAFPPGVGGAIPARARDAGQALMLSVLLPPDVAEPTLRVTVVTSAGTEVADAIIPGYLVRAWWMVDLQAMVGASTLSLRLNGVDLPLPALAGTIAPYAGSPALSVLNDTDGASPAIGTDLLAALFAWRDVPLSFSDHLDDAGACGLL